jgi:hypothetical protein
MNANKLPIQKSTYNVLKRYLGIHYANTNQVDYVYQ